MFVYLFMCGLKKLNENILNEEKYDDISIIKLKVQRTQNQQCLIQFFFWIKDHQCQVFNIKKMFMFSFKIVDLFEQFKK